MFTDGHDEDTAKFEKAKVQNSAGLKYMFYKAMLKVSSFWEAAVCQQNWTAGIPLKMGTLSHHHYFAMWLWKILKFQILIQSDMQMSQYFSI